MMRFTDKVVLVTGATQNTGVAIAALFLEEGAKVCINGPCAESIEQGAQQLREMGFSDFLVLAADIADRAQVEKMFATIKEVHGRIDILVNNACHQGIGASFEEMTVDYFSDVIRTNIIGTFQVSQQAVGMMLQQDSKGVIVNLGSNVSMRAIHKRVAYVTSKGGVDALTRAMAIDLGPKGIRVNMVAPGYINTNRWETLPEQTMLRRRLNTPLGMESSTRDIAEAVAFLASDAARTICGERLVVDAGCSAQHLPPDIDV